MRVFFQAATAVLFLIHGSGAWAQSPDGAAVRFVAHADRPMITLERVHGMIRGLQERPLLHVYGDGRVRVERPAYMVDPGVYEFRLDAGEVDELIRSLDRDGVTTMDGAALRAQRDAAARSRRFASGERLMTTDPTMTRIRFDFASYARGAAAPAPLDNRVRYSDLQVDALRFGQLRSLQALASAEKRLLSLVDRARHSTAAEAQE